MARTSTVVELDEAGRTAAHDLILVLADSKRLLGMRYAEWILGAPELEAGIACASMAQDEWGHARLLYALLKDFGADVERVEHGREAVEYCSMVALDAAPADWAGLVAMNVLCDGALSVQLEALRNSSYVPLRQRVGKLLDEERFHAAHGAAWWRRFASASEASRAALHDAVQARAGAVLAWFGPDGPNARTLLDASIADGAGSTLRERFVERIAPLLATAGLGDVFTNIEPAFDDFDEARRRSAGRAPDSATIERIRGDRNRAFLMD
jgi:ring-1,2-phenylacetyl-CoA epoxidase subunit PaaC